MTFRYKFTVFVLFLTVLAVVTGCAKKPIDEKAAIQINSYEMGAGEFNRLFQEVRGEEPDTPEFRQAFLDNMINQKLLLQEAERQGLNKNRDFLRSIQRFWEQSLLQLVVEKKIKDTSKNITVSEQEAAIGTWIGEMKKDARIKIDKKAIGVE